MANTDPHQTGMVIQLTDSAQPNKNVIRVLHVDDELCLLKFKNRF